MFAINHAATALVIKKKFPDASIIWLLISVQFIELLWVAFNFMGIEKTTTDSVVRSVFNIHLVHMPFSHSVLMTVVLALVAWLVISKGLNKPALGLAVSIGIVSHIILDLFTHSTDIALSPFTDSIKWGLGLYSIPILGFVVETAYGIWCWWIYKGNRKLLATIIIFNLMNVSFFSAAILGPEIFLANHPLIITTLIFLQIVITLTLVGIFANSKQHAKVQPGKPAVERY
jgi:membrane-bound metal-dependent hydrolase YbcI (DUF457 family)